MQLEFRKTSDTVCPTCGAHELVHVAGLPLTDDLTGLLEREMVKREIGLAKIFRAHLEDVANGHAIELHAANTDGRELFAVLSALPEDTVAGWRLIRKRRERIFRERIETRVAAMLERTRLPMTPAPNEPVIADRS